MQTMADDKTLTDLWASCGRRGSYVTCRFNTRIDYIFADRLALKAFLVERCDHIIDDMSDHNAVVATIKIQGGDD